MRVDEFAGPFCLHTYPLYAHRNFSKRYEYYMTYMTYTYTRIVWLYKVVGHSVKKETCQIADVADGLAHTARMYTLHDGIWLNILWNVPHYI